MLLDGFTEFKEHLEFLILKRIQEKKRLEMREIIRILTDELLHEEHRDITGHSTQAHATQRKCVLGPRHTDYFFLAFADVYS